MNYAKVENGQVTRVGLPAVGTLQDGSTVSGYNLLDDVTLRTEGWLPLIDTSPTYNPETEYLEHAGYTVADTEVVVNYLVKLREPVVVAPTLEERLAAVEEYLMSL